MSRYRHAKIYKLVSNKKGLTYVGSTCLTLPQRLSQHQRDYKQYLKTGKKYNVHMSSFKVLEGGDTKIILLEIILVNIENNYMIEKFITLIKQIV
jgi:GIY-YIG catalytic domain